MKTTASTVNSRIGSQSRHCSVDLRVSDIPVTSCHMIHSSCTYSTGQPLVWIYFYSLWVKRRLTKAHIYRAIHHPSLPIMAPDPNQHHVVWGTHCYAPHLIRRSPDHMIAAMRSAASEIQTDCDVNGYRCCRAITKLPVSISRRTAKLISLAICVIILRTFCKYSVREASQISGTRELRVSVFHCLLFSFFKPSYLYFLSQLMRHRVETYGYFHVRMYVRI